MSTLVKEIMIPESHRISIDLPPEISTGKARITLKIEPEGVNRVGELYGTGKGEFWMADDFDAPMEDFKDYM